MALKAIELIRRWVAPAQLAEQLSRFERMVDVALRSLAESTQPKWTVRTTTTATGAAPWEVIIASVAPLTIRLPGLNSSDIGSQIIVRRAAPSGTVSVSHPDGTSNSLDGTTNNTSRTYLWNGSSYVIVGVA